MSTQTTPSYHEYTNLSRLSLVHEPLQVITSTQTSSGYTSPNLPLRSRPLKIEINSFETMKVRKGLLHNGEELHNGFRQPKTLYALNSKLTIDTQYIFFNVLYDVFLFFVLQLEMLLYM